MNLSFRDEDKVHVQQIFHMIANQLVLRTLSHEFDILDTRLLFLRQADDSDPIALRFWLLVVIIGTTEFHSRKKIWKLRVSASKVSELLSSLKSHPHLPV